MYCLAKKGVAWGERRPRPDLVNNRSTVDTSTFRIPSSSPSTPDGRCLYHVFLSLITSRQLLLIIAVPFLHVSPLSSYSSAPLVSDHLCPANSDINVVHRQFDPSPRVSYSRPCNILSSFQHPAPLAGLHCSSTIRRIIADVSPSHSTILLYYTILTLLPPTTSIVFLVYHNPLPLTPSTHWARITSLPPVNTSTIRDTNPIIPCVRVTEDIMHMLIVYNLIQELTRTARTS